MEKENNSSMEELLTAIKFLIYFEIGKTAFKSKMQALVGLKIAFRKTNGYMQSEISEIFYFAKNLFQIVFIR